MLNGLCVWSLLLKISNMLTPYSGTIVNSLQTRCKPYLPQITSTILWRLNNKSATVRQQAADLISRIAMVMKQCSEDALMGKLGVVLYGTRLMSHR